LSHGSTMSNSGGHAGIRADRVGKRFGKMRSGRAASGIVLRCSVCSKLSERKLSIFAIVIIVLAYIILAPPDNFA
jgi:hypothetical protein